MADDPRAEAKREAAIVAAAALAAVYGAARTNIMTRVANGIREALLLDYWMPRVATANEKALKRIAADAARSVSTNVSISRMDAYLEEAALGRAEGWAEILDANLAAIDAMAEDFERQALAIADEMVSQAPADAEDIAVAATEFGTIEGEKANGKTTKTWHLGASANHRASHVALNGVTIGIDERFANGLRYPKAPGPPAETVNCDCFLTYGGE